MQGHTDESETGDEQLETLAGAIVEAADAAGIGLLITTSRTLEPRTVYVSDAAVGIFGYSRDELLAMPTFELVAPEALDDILAIAQNNVEGTFTPAFESTVVRKDGTHVPLELAVSQVELEGMPVAVAFLFDISQRQQAKEALRRSEDRFRTLIESAAEAVWITDGTTLTYANPAAIELFGYERLDEVLGKPTLDFVHPQDRPAVQERVRAMLGRGEELPPHEYRVRRRDGGMMTLEVSSIGTEYEGRRVLLSFGRDVTERKQYETQLLQADRLSALGMLAGGMAHAINNPLTYVLLNLEHLGRRLPGLADHKSYLGEAMVRLREAHHGAERVASVVRQMRAFSRSEGDGATDVDVRRVLDAAVGMVGNEIRHRGRLVTRYEDVPAVHATEARLEQVFLNLLVHAAQSLPEGEAGKGKVEIITRVEPPDYVVIEVSDNGPALEPEQVERVFEPFSPRGEQTGIGLSVCHGIVEALGGSMQVESEQGRGTTFRVTLPSSASERTGSTPAPHPDSAPSSPQPARARVLVVDDDPGVGSALTIMLEDEHEVTCRTDAQEALRLLLRDNSYDIVFCDLMMPDVSGMDLFEALRLNRPGEERKLVFMTGGAFTPEAKRFLSKATNLRIEKPFNLKELRRLVRRAVLGESLGEG